MWDLYCLIFDFLHELCLLRGCLFNELHTSRALSWICCVDHCWSWWHVLGLEQLWYLLVAGSYLSVHLSDSDWILGAWVMCFKLSLLWSLVKGIHRLGSRSLEEFALHACIRLRLLQLVLIDVVVQQIAPLRLFEKWASLSILAQLWLRLLAQFKVGLNVQDLLLLVKVDLLIRSLRWER